ncbi:MAG: CRTAC1 family protein [Bryobacteraceae bacterium]
MRALAALLLFVPPAEAPPFEDTAAKAGLSFHLVSGDPKEKKFLIESIGGGLAVIDFDGDGWIDLFLPNGATIAAARAGRIPQRAALYRNNRDGTFTDVAAKAGVAVQKAWGKGALAADFNGDGHTDLYVVNFGPNSLYLNNGDGTFTDATAKSGAGDPRWSSAAAAVDFDGDGDLDIFVANYVDYDLNRLPTEGKFCLYLGIPVACGPRGLAGAGDALYRNNGDGTFADVAKIAGVADPAGYYGLGAAWGDYDLDGDMDLFVANDSTPNYLYRNNGDGTFTDVGIEAGVAFSEEGKEQACMGVEFEDLDNDGLPEIAVTNFSNDYNTLYRNRGSGRFEDDSHAAGLVQDSWSDLSWGVGFFDFDNDGAKDIFIASGHIYPQVDTVRINTSFRQPNRLYMNQGGKLAPALAPGEVRSSRGAVFADFDNDGRIDIAIAEMDAPPTLLMNRSPGAAHWLMIRLEGKKNRDGVGAVVTVKTASATQTRQVKAGGSYASTNDPRQHFGLGAASAAEVTVRWPGGAETRVENVAADRVVTVRE